MSSARLLVCYLFRKFPTIRLRSAYFMARTLQGLPNLKPLGTLEILFLNEKCIMVYLFPNCRISSLLLDLYAGLHYNERSLVHTEASDKESEELQQIEV